MDRDTYTSLRKSQDLWHTLNFSFWNNSEKKTIAKESEIKVLPAETYLKEQKTKKILKREPNLVGRAIKKIYGKIDQVSI